MKEFVRKLIFGDWLLKLFSLMLALLTWLAVSDSLRKKPVNVPGKPDLVEQSFYDIRVRPMSADSDVREFKFEPSKVNITLQGDKSVMQNVERGLIRIQVDLTDFSPTNGAKRRFEVIPPDGTTTMRVQPEEVEVIPPPFSNPKAVK